MIYSLQYPPILSLRYPWSPRTNPWTDPFCPLPGIVDRDSHADPWSLAKSDLDMEEAA